MNPMSESRRHRRLLVNQICPRATTLACDRPVGDYVKQFHVIIAGLGDGYLLFAGETYPRAPKGLFRRGSVCTPVYVYHLGQCCWDLILSVRRRVHVCRR